MGIDMPKNSESLEELEKQLTSILDELEDFSARGYFSQLSHINDLKEMLSEGYSTCEKIAAQSPDTSTIHVVVEFKRLFALYSSIAKDGERAAKALMGPDEQMLPSRRVKK